MVAIDFNNDANLKCVVKVIRSLCTSRKNCQATVYELFADYKETEGCHIPFRKYGFQTFQQFLVASGEFEVSGQLVRAKKSEATEHIVRLVAKQKASQQRVKRFAAPRFTKAACLKRSVQPTVVPVEKPIEKKPSAPENLVDPRIKVLYGQFRRSKVTETETDSAEETTDWNVDGLKGFEKLERYCTVNKLERPRYSSYKTKDSQYQGKVSVSSILSHTK
jgi:OST-HTH/LOTUS domain